MHHAKTATTVLATTISPTTTTTASTTEPPAPFRSALARARGSLAAVLVLVLVGACGGGSTVSGTGDDADEARNGRSHRRAGAPRAVPVRPIQIHVSPKRSGGSLEVAIE